jgi:hypothetical protein
MEIEFRNSTLMIWNQKGNKFSGKIYERFDIVDINLLPRIKELGSVFSIAHQWKISCELSELKVLIQVFYQFKPSEKKFSKETLHKLAIESISVATERLNLELKNRGIKISTRDEPAIAMNFRFEILLAKALIDVYLYN